MNYKELNKHPIITKTTIKKILGCKDDYAYTVLNRLLKRKKIKKITKGKYTTKDDIYLIAANLYSPNYLSYWSCSYYKGYTEQIVNTIQVVTTMPHKNISFQNYKIEFHKHGKKMFFGYEKIKYNNDFIFIAEDEKLIIDAVSCEELMGNFDEIIKIIINSKISKDKLINYLKKINNASLTKRVGFLLEKYKNMDISSKINYKDRNYVQVSKYLTGKKINKKWMIKHDI